jgi:hypothetical protein
MRLARIQFKVVFEAIRKVMGPCSRFQEAEVIRWVQGKDKQ